MATALTLNPQKITLADTNEVEYTADDLLEDLGFQNGIACFDSFSAATQINVNGQAITAASGSYSSGSIYLPIKKGYPIKLKGSASATLNIAIQMP